MTRSPVNRINRKVVNGVASENVIEFQFDGETLAAYPGESIAAALIANGIMATRRSRSGMARGYYCGMGVCWECLVTVDSVVNQRACMTAVQAGMMVQSSVSPKKS